MRPRFTKAYGFGLVTGLFFLLSWVGQFIAQYFVEVKDADEHLVPFEWGDFLAQFAASTLENWQSEFLQLVWQAAGLALFYYWGSSQSKEGDDRVEAKLDAICRAFDIDPAEISESVTKEADKE